MDFRRFMVQGIDGEFNFLPGGGLDENQGSLSAKSVNNETPMIDAKPISVVHPLNVAENIVDSYNTSPEEDELSPVGPSASPYPEAEGFHKRAQNVLAQASKVVGDASTPLDVDSDPDIHEFPSARELKDVTDCHWVIAHLISVLHKARASCDAIREREIKKDKAYAELEKKCNEALQDLDKNPLVSDMRAEIETLQGQVSGLHNEYSRLVLEEKKWVNYEQTLSILHAKVEGLESERERLKTSETKLLQEIDSLRQDRAATVTKVIPDAAMKLVHSDETSVLVTRLVKASIIHGRCVAFKEVADLKEPFVLEKMPGYHPFSKEEAVVVEKATVTLIFEGFLKMACVFPAYFLILLGSKFWIILVYMLISMGITASEPQTRLKGVSPLLDFGDVLCAHRTCGSSLTHP
ncbi:hypothetical protein Tco_0664859 [Tanacetum coccineum]